MTLMITALATVGCEKPTSMPANTGGIKAADLEETARVLDQCCPLISAIAAKDEDLALDLMRTSQQDLTRPDPIAGITPLGWAVRMRLPSIIKPLVEAGVEKAAPGGDGLFHAAMTGQEDLVKLLLDHGWNPNRPGPQGLTPLMVAASGGHIDSTRLLLVRGADLNAESAEGLTSLDYADRAGHENIVDLLQVDTD